MSEKLCQNVLSTLPILTSAHLGPVRFEVLVHGRRLQEHQKRPLQKCQRLGSNTEKNKANIHADEQCDALIEKELEILASVLDDVLFGNYFDSSAKRSPDVFRMLRRKR
jgi:hypothetical protein